MIEYLFGEVAYWHERTFGSRESGKCSSDRVLAKVKEEMHEFMDAPSAEEASDVIIALCAWCYRNGDELPSILARKWKQVRERTDQIERDAERGIPA